jgi:hypothetical protein
MRRNNPAQRMTPWQHDPPMIDLRRRPAAQFKFRRARSLNQCPAARWTPVRQSLRPQHSMAMAANPFHDFKRNGSGRPLTEKIFQYANPQYLMVQR